MIGTGVTVEQACERWVGGFNAIPQSFLEKFCKVGGMDEFYEITPPSVGDRVYVYNVPDGCDHGGEVAEYDEDKDEWLILLDSHETISKAKDDFEVERDGFFPMWGTMWTFGDRADEYWLEELGGLQKMADCGFRIYEQEDLGYIFGIDGCGYDFYSAHWIPLYRMRGLRWHDEELDKEAS